MGDSLCRTNSFRNEFTIAQKSLDRIFDRGRLPAWTRDSNALQARTVALSAAIDPSRDVDDLRVSALATTAIVALQKLRCYNGSMNTILPSFTSLSDCELLSEVKRLAASEREATAHMIASLAELDARRLYLGEGCSSLFTYCVEVLHLSEDAAYNRIQAARAARKFPVVLERLADGSLHLTAVRLLAPHLTADNHAEMLESARHKGKREIELLVARLHPQPEVPASIRKLPPASGSRTLTNEQQGAHAAPVPSACDVAMTSPAAPCAVVRPLAPERYKLQFTVSYETHDKLRRVQDLMRHRIPNGDVAFIFDRALDILLAELERTKFAAAARPRARTLAASPLRRVPAAVRRAVWARDAGRCAFIGSTGRCSETGFLEFHHVVPYAAGGATSVDNLELRCRAHNVYEAEQYFAEGTLFVRERPCREWGRTRSGTSICP